MGIEYLPTIPSDDVGPWHCYVLWIEEEGSYYVGHTGNLGARLKAHFDDEVETTASYRKEHVYTSEELDSRTDSRRFELDLKRVIMRGDAEEFKVCTGKGLIKGANLMEASSSNY